MMQGFAYYTIIPISDYQTENVQEIITLSNDWEYLID